MRLRPLDPGDSAACAAIAQERGWRPHAEAWRIAISLGAGAALEGPGGGVAAAAILVHHGERAGVLSVLVSPRHAGQGLGRRAAGAALEAAGARAVELLAPPAGVPFAARLGFRPAGFVARFVGRPRPVPRAEPRATLRPVSGTDFPAVVAVDEAAFGANRRALLEALFPHAVRACLAVAGGRTVGYGLAWAEGEQLAVGPVVAEDEAVGAAMVGWLAAGGDREVRVDVPVERTAIASAAYAAGLAPRGRITRLVRADPIVGRRERLHALAAPWAG
jgi:ribosomal protein S18 acetylase RimI-like enzyme